MKLSRQRFAVILAGGDGKRLLPFTRRIHGDDRPKQFSTVLGGETLLRQTRSRVSQIVSPARTHVVVTKAHERFYRDELRELSADTIAVQPFNHGTSQAILFCLLRIDKLDPDAVVAFFPSDHHFQDGMAFSNQIHQAFEMAEAHEDEVVLLGIEADSPETSYGWIEPGEPLDAGFRVRRFWEKPTKHLASKLMKRGCLWNSFVMIGTAGAFLELFSEQLPELFRKFRGRSDDFLTAHESQAVRELYAASDASNFSEAVLAKSTERLAVLPGRQLGWSDLGEPARVLSVLGLENFVLAQIA